MNRFAKKFRVLGSLCLLLNFIALVLPVTRRVQENYADLTWNQLDYIKGALSRVFPDFAEETSGMGSAPAGWVLFFIVLPLLLALIAGIWGLAGNHAQKVSSILSFLVLFLNIGMAADIGRLWPEADVGQTYCRGTACTLVLFFSGLAAVFAIAALVSTPGKIKTAETVIPQVEEIKQEQVEAKYNIMMDVQQKPQPQKGPEHGVLVGRTGLYAGAEIPLTDGECIRMGRQADNHLVFSGQDNISRSHCQIKWDEKRQKYIFRDYSANGTFANGSADCLPQNLDLDLDPGTTIALGDENNMFYLK